MSATKTSRERAEQLYAEIKALQAVNTSRSAIITRIQHVLDRERWAKNPTKIAAPQVAPGSMTDALRAHTERIFNHELPIR